MAVMMIFESDEFTPERYARVNELMGVLDDDSAPDGLINHVAGLTDDGALIVIDLWESEQALGEFFESRLGPALRQLEIPDQQPRMLLLHHMAEGAGAEGNVVILIEVDDSTDTYDRMAAEMPEHRGEAEPGWHLHSAAADSDGLVVFDMWPSEEAFGQFAQEKVGPLAQKHGMGEMKQRTLTVHNHIKGKTRVDA